MKPRTPARAEVVGSLLRPQALRAAIAEIYEPGHSALLGAERAKDLSRLRALEDDAVAAAVRRQVDLGLDVVSDGELRRWMFLNSFYDAVDGFTTDKIVTFTNARGDEVPLAVHRITGRLAKIDSPEIGRASCRERVYVLV